MSATSGGGGSVSEGSDAGGSSQSTMSVNDSPSTSFQTNLVTENVTKITLSEENGTGGYVADMTGSKINLTLDERQQKDGIINVAFDYEEGVNRGGSGVGDEFRSVNGSEKKDKVPEAVNLELVNMVPYSNGNGTSYGVPVNGIPGIPMKKDSEQVDMSTPYDEYFVPVNEHKKYMRGEKLYVTKDKRRPASWRRCLSWIVACTVISVVLILAILAGTGVILSQEPDLVKDASVGRNFAGSNLKPSVTNKSPALTAEKLIYVPRSIESEFVIDNLDFDPALKDLNSSAYQQFASNMENHLKMLLFDKETLEFGASDVGVKVVNISRDPFKVNYRIGWNYKQGVNNPPEPIKMEDVKRRLVESLATNQGYIDKYHIDREAIKVNHVINECQIENGGCSHICYYNYRTQLFTCTCPTHLVLDTTGKNCVPWTGSSEDDAVPIPSHAAYPGMPYESTSSPAHEFEYSSNFHHGVQQGVHYNQEPNSEHINQEHGGHEPAAEPTPEPTSKSDSSQEDKALITSEVNTPALNEKEKHEEELHHGFHADGVNSHHGKPNTQPAPEPTAEPTSDSKYHDQAHFVYESAAEPGVASTARKNDDSAVHSANEYKNGDPSVELTPEPAPEPVPEPNPESDDHDQVIHSVYGSKDHEPAAEPTPEPAPEPNPASNDHGHIIHPVEYGSKDHEPAAEPTPEPTAEPIPGSNDHGHVIHPVEYGSKDHEPAAEPTPEPAPEPAAENYSKDKVHSVHSTHDSKDGEPTAEPTPEPASEPNPGSNDHDQVVHSVYRSKNHEPSAEPTPEPAPESTKEPNPGSDTHDYAVHFIHDSSNHEPSAEPTPEPAPESAKEPNPGSDNHDYAVHSIHDSSNHEPSAEPTPELAPESSSESHDQVVHPASGSKNHEPAAEPTPEPAPEPIPGSDDHDQVVHSVHDSKNHELAVESAQEPAPKPTAGSSPEDQGKEYGVHSVHEIKDLPEATTVNILTNGNQATENNSEYTPKLTPVLSPDDDYRTHSSKAQGNEFQRTVTTFMPAQDKMNSGLNPSLHDSTEQPVQHQDQIQEINIKTGHMNGADTNRQSEPDKISKSEHQMPHLHDILIRKASESDEKNATTHGQNILQNVELKENGEPVLEEVLIDKSLKKGPYGSETSYPAIISTPHSDNESILSNPTFAKDSPDLKNGVTEFPNNNLTNEPTLIIKHPNESGVANPMRTDVTEIGSVSPKNIANSTAQQSGLDGKDVNKTYFEYIDTPVVVEHNQGPTHDFNVEISHFGVDGKPVNPNSETDQEHKPVNLSQGRVSDSTIRPKVQREYHTIPVLVEVSGYSENNPNISGKPKQESNPESEEHHRTEKPDVGRGGSPETSEVLLNGGESDQTKIYKTTTESHIAMTTLFSVLVPHVVDGKMNIELTDEREKATDLRDTTGKHRSKDINETTKSPEEFSNNIKDELLDNEEFNTLLGKEHDKEAGSNDGKELTGKYPSKLHKGDKKKIKDYVKNDKLDSDKKLEATARPPVTPGDFVLQKHVNGNENAFDLEYSLQNEHTTKRDGEITVINSHGFDGVPGVSFKPHGISNHDLRVLQTVAPDSNSETGQPQESEVQKSDSKVKLLDNKEGEKQDKDYAKFDKDYKYEKQKVSKKKDLKKKTGSGKDGKNVELDDGHIKYVTDTSKENPETSQEFVKDVSETVSPFEKITVQPEIGVRLISGAADETTAMPDYKEKVETTFQPSNINTLEKRTEAPEVVPEYTGQPKSSGQEIGSTTFGKPNVRVQNGDQQRKIPIDQSYHQMIDEPSVKTMSSTSSGTIYTDSGTEHLNINSSGPFTVTENSDLTTKAIKIIPGTVFDGIADGTISQGLNTGIEINGTTVDGGVHSTSFLDPKIATSKEITPEYRVINTTTANPTIIIHGQSGSLQDGHTLRFANSTFHNATTVIPQLNGTFGHSDGQVYTLINYTTTFPNGSVVQPTIIVRGQSGTLQDGHEIRFGNTTFITSPPSDQYTFKNSTVYKIENGSLPDTVFDGHFNPQDGHYHMFTNSSGTYVFSNVTVQPTFVIKGDSGDFGNSRAYIIANNSGTTFSRSFTRPSVIFRNSTVFAVGNTQGKDTPTVGIQEVTAPDVSSNETIHYTRQMSPNFFSTGTAYKVNNYFGYISKCAAGQFQCVNGTSKRGSACISLSSKCDSINDCSDGSDELGCIENGCPGNFQCSDGSCLKRNLVCNGILDCSDGSDEKQCENWKCEFDEFQCPSGRCIPVVWQCDGKPDCDNHTDEYNCQTSCGNDEYLCPEGWCVPLTYRCNGIKECNMGEDEQLCDCSHEEFKCQTGGCISMKQVCDGLDDCPDRSDEWDCVKLEPGSNLLKIKTGSGDFEPVCADNWTSRSSDDICASLGYYSSVPIENEKSSSITTETSFFILKNGSTDNFNKKVIVNLKKSEGNCSSGKLVTVSCQDFSCGSRSMTDSSSVEARLVGGMSATAGQWPSVALLYNIRNFHSCTANILTPRWVLASYNCLKMGNKNLNEQDWKFFGGSTVFETERENAETRKILSIIPHPQVKFNQFLFSNDLALVELDQSLQFTNNMGAVCLPEQEMQPRQICVTAGWGMDAPEDKSIRQQLQYLPVPTMNLTECNSTEHYSGFITDDKICAGYNSAQKSLCYNEEGAPLMCVNDKGEWELQGVLSYHSACGRGSHPSIFSSITPVTDWIKKTIGNPFERKAVAITKR